MRLSSPTTWCSSRADQHITDRQQRRSATGAAFYFPSVAIIAGRPTHKICVAMRVRNYFSKTTSMTFDDRARVLNLLSRTI
jgi:hypothetical protein